MLFKTHFKYSYFHKFSHIASGCFIAAVFNYSDSLKFKLLSAILLLCVLFYQLGQYVFNIRIFIDLLEIKKDNSLKHTLNKLSEYFLGVLIYVLSYFMINELKSI